MWLRISAIFLAIVLSFTLMGTAWAGADKNTERLKTLYKSYQTALADGDYRLAFIAAQDTWQSSEDVLGAAKQTGDFAYNTAILGKILAGKKRDKRVEKAFSRSLELSHLHGEKAGAITLRRQLDFIGYWLQIDQRKKADALFKSAEQLAQSNDLMQSNTYALLLNEKSKLAYKRRDYETANTAAQTAYTIFDTLQISETKEAYEVLYNLALAQTKMGIWREAVLGFEKVYTNVDNVLPPNSPLIGRAFLSIGAAQSGYLKEHELEYSELKDIVKCFGCWPKFDVKYWPNLNKGNELKFERHAPKMPRNALASGFVVLMFDTDAEGVPDNIKIIQASHARMFDKSSVNVAKTWKVTEPDTGRPAKYEKGLVTSVTFILTGRKGKMLDFYGVPIE